MLFNFLVRRFHRPFGMQIDSRVAIQQLHNGSGVICQQCAGHPNWVVGANNDIYDVEAYQRFGSTYNLSTGTASPPAFLGWLLAYGKVGQVSGDVPIGMRGDFINCPNGCRQIWRNTSQITDPRTVALWYAAAAAPYLPEIYSGVGELWMIVEVAFPGATAATVDVLSVMTPPWAIPSTVPGMIVTSYEIYQWARGKD